MQLGLTLGLLLLLAAPQIYTHMRSNKSKKTTLARFLNALGIRHVGQNAAKILESHFHGNLELVMVATKEELVELGRKRFSSRKDRSKKADF